MYIFRWPSLFGLLLFFASCSTRNTLTGFDADVWKNDRNACENKRADLIESLLKQKEKILGLNELDVIGLLGKPDQQEIYKRSEKFHYYFIEPGPTCKEFSTSPKRLIIRFNAVGLAKEINVE